MSDMYKPVNFDTVQLVELWLPYPFSNFSVHTFAQIVHFYKLSKSSIFVQIVQEFVQIVQGLSKSSIVQIVFCPNRPCTGQGCFPQHLITLRHHYHCPLQWWKGLASNRWKTTPSTLLPRVHTYTSSRQTDTNWSKNARTCQPFSSRYTGCMVTDTSGVYGATEIGLSYSRSFLANLNADTHTLTNVFLTSYVSWVCLLIGVGKSLTL